jgi:hypothetical protein
VGVCCLTGGCLTGTAPKQVGCNQVCSCMSEASPLMWHLGVTIGSAKQVHPACLDQIWGRGPMIDPGWPFPKKREKTFPCVWVHTQVCEAFI